MSKLSVVYNDNPRGILLEIEISTYEQMVYAQTVICPGKWNAQTSLGFYDINRSFNLDQKTRPSDS